MLKDSWGQQLRTSQGTAVIALGRRSGSCLLLYDKVTGYKLLVKQLLVRLPGDPPLTGSTLALKPTPWASSHKRGRGQANSTNWKEKDTQMVKGRDDQCPWVGWTCLSATSCPPRTTRLGRNPDTGEAEVPKWPQRSSPCLPSMAGGNVSSPPSRELALARSKAWTWGSLCGWRHLKRPLWNPDGGQVGWPEGWCPFQATGPTSTVIK